MSNARRPAKTPAGGKDAKDREEESRRQPTNCHGACSRVAHEPRTEPAQRVCSRADSGARTSARKAVMCTALSSPENRSRSARWESAAAARWSTRSPTATSAAMVSRTPVFIFDPTRENALAHEHVIETVMKTHTIIPMSFGTVFRTDDDIREVLRSIYPSVKDVLKQMAGKVEFGLKVTWDRDHVVEELQREHEEIHRFHQEITRKHLQSTYFARMQLGRMIDKALDGALGGVCARDLRRRCGPSAWPRATTSRLATR